MKNRAGPDFKNGQSSKREVIKYGINQGPLTQTSEEASQRQQLLPMGGKLGFHGKGTLRGTGIVSWDGRKNVLKLTG